jgi:hypothetical protein
VARFLALQTAHSRPGMKCPLRPRASSQKSHASLMPTEMARTIQQPLSAFERWEAEDASDV